MDNWSYVEPHLAALLPGGHEPPAAGHAGDLPARGPHPQRGEGEGAGVRGPVQGARHLVVRYR